MKKLLTLLGSIGMIVGTVATVIACNPEKMKKTDIGAVKDIKKSLTHLTNENKETIINEFVQINKDVKGLENLKNKDLEATVNEIEKNAIITVKDDSKEFTGKVVVTYTIKVDKPKIQLSTIIQTTILGEIDKKEEESIRAVVLKKNPESAKATYKVSGIGKNSATLTGTGEYAGDVAVKYQIKLQMVKKGDIKKVIEDVLKEPVINDIDAWNKIENALNKDNWGDKVSWNIEEIEDQNKFTIKLTAKSGYELDDPTPFDVTYKTTDLIDDLKNAIHAITDTEIPFENGEIAKKEIEDLLKEEPWTTKLEGTVTIFEDQEKYSVVLTAKPGYKLESETTITGTVKFATKATR
ncbi:lipoprotein [Williamsoniiplasma luminosum]|uniref:Lipoprotein n=1 Tax=Williamsoniiplasma luminosum TaxID=214888 RepID=A0A2S0NIZ7_9MOLU|nr:lipoprotein [Williamsoniiplasma luminosum]AVP48983.1 MAG: hypothetical protein C5T88_00035 [Williamsoniiplasma luminosum]